MSVNCEIFANLCLTFVSSSSLRPSPPWRISCPTLAWTPDYQHTCNRTSGVNKNSCRLIFVVLSLCALMSILRVSLVVVRVEFSDEDESRCDAVPCGSWMLPGTTRRLYADCDTFMAPAVHNVWNSRLQPRPMAHLVYYLLTHNDWGENVTINDPRRRQNVPLATYLAVLVPPKY